MTANGNGKRVVISGVSRGLGRAMAHEFARLGHTVIGCARNADAIAELQAELGAPHEFAAVDVADATAVQAWAEGVLARGPAPDFLLNNAALINQPAPLWDVPVAEFSAMMDVNVKGAFHLIRAFVPAMIARGSGMVVNFSSGWGRSASGDVAPYCATKWGIEGLSQSLADELPHGLGCVALNPGIIDTDMLRISFHGQTSAYPSPEKWAVRAVPFILKLTPAFNGQPMSV